MMMKCEFVCLWKSRVQYLRQYYCCDRPKQKAYPVISPHVWFLPLFLTLWWTVITALFLVSPKLHHLLAAGDVLDVVHVLLVLDCLLILLWWQLAVTQSQREMTKPQAHQSKDPLCSCPMCTDDEKVKVHSSLVESPLGGDWKSFLLICAVHCSNLRVVVHLLLMLAGDVETNPGPEQLTMKDHSKVVKYLENLNGRDLEQLSKALGLSLRTTVPLVGELVCAWLNREDNVIERSGEPSWKSLESALCKIGQEGLATTIAQDDIQANVDLLKDAAMSATSCVDCSDQSSAASVSASVPPAKRKRSSMNFKGPVEDFFSDNSGAFGSGEGGRGDGTGRSNFSIDDSVGFSEVSFSMEGGGEYRRAHSLGEGSTAVMFPNNSVQGYQQHLNSGLFQQQQQHGSLHGNTLQQQGTASSTGNVLLPEEKTNSEYGGPIVGSKCSRPHGAQIIDLTDTENLESGSKELESEELQSAEHAVSDRHMAFVVCERVFNNLLAWAATRDVRYLLAAQRSLTAVQNQQGDAALHLGIIHAHQDMVLQLLDVLPQLPPTETPIVDLLNNLQQSPLHLAVLTRQHKVIQYLLKANANPLVCDRTGNTPLHLACRMGFVQGTVTLLDRTNHINAEGCRIPEVNIRNSNGKTPLHLAAICGHAELLKLLVNDRADVNVQDSKSGKTALHHSVEKGDVFMAGYLVSEANCTVDCCDFSGNTPLHVASRLGREDLTTILIAAGANSIVFNEEGESPMDLAKYDKNDYIIKMLEKELKKVAGDVDPIEWMANRQKERSDQRGSDQRGSNQRRGDLSKLDYRARLSLSFILDKNEEWRKLCRFMNLEGGFTTFTSPTRDLLSMYEACNGTVDELRQFLVVMNRPDAVDVIDKALGENKEGGTPSAEATALRDEIHQHMTACLKIIKEKLTVDINIIRLVSFGLPRSGKTSTLLRLMGEILNILTANKKEQPSTGVVEERGLVIIRNLSTEIATISSGIWSKPESLQEEAGIYNQLLYQVANSDPTRAEEDSATSIEESAASRPHTDVLSGKDRASPIGEDKASSPITDPTKSETMEEDTDEMLSAFRESMQAEDWDKVKYLLNDIVLLINTDTGGHAEFLEMHAALVMGPSLYLLFSRLTDQLDSIYKVYYTNEEGVSTDKEDSTLTVEEVLFQALSSIECFSECFLENDRNGAAKRYSNHLKSKALFVGTHRDKVTDQELREKDELLKKRIQNTSFYKSDTIENAYEDRMMLAVNNYDGDQAELDGIRAVLEDIIKSFRKITIPASWLMFSICIRKRKIRTMKLEECVKLAGSLRISSSELQEALWFLHHHAGLILYYPNLEALKDIVICDVQVVFDSVTKLAKETFTFSKFRKRATEIKESGQFSQDDIEKAMSDSTSLIPLDKLVKLLEYLNILTSFIPVSSKRASSSQGVVYFMPSILKSARNDELTVQTSSHDPAPLMLQSECGYVPMGIFTYMITSIVSQRLDGWEMIQDPIRKNKVKFYVGDDYDMVTLISRPLYIEVIITRQESELNLQTSTKDLCARIRSVIWSTLETVTSHIYHQLDMKYKYCFECPKHPGKDHLCVLAKEGAKFMECLQNPKRKEPIRLKPVHGVWFGESLSGNVQFRGDSFHIANVPSHQLTADDHDEVCRCLRNLDDEQLIELGGSLGLNFPRLRRMKSHPADMVCAWLNGEDRVTCYDGKDTRSWKALIETLKDNSQAGIAKDISEYLKKKS